MRKNRIATIVLAALSLVNFIVGGIMGFILPNSENKKVFAFIFLVCLAAAVITLLCDWMTLKQANARTEYKVLKLRKGRLVREPRRMKPDNDGLKALHMGISGWLFSLIVPLFACGMIWSDTLWLLSFNVLIKFTVVAIMLSGLIFGIIEYIKTKGEKV